MNIINSSSRVLLSRYLWLAIATVLISTPTLVDAQLSFHPASLFGSGAGGGYAGYGGGDDDGGDAFGSGNGFGGDDNGNNGFSTTTSAAIQSAQRRRDIHGALAAVAFVILFPLGAIALRVLPGRAGFWAHALVQMAAWVVYIAAAALGFQLVKDFRFGGQEEGWLLTDPNFHYHPIIGIVVFLLLLAQPLLGWLHHRNFKRLLRRTVPSHLHLWNGRVVVVLGIVNGGLGLQLAGAGDTVKLAYTIVAAVLGGSWLVLSVLAEARRARGKDVFGRKRGQQQRGAGAGAHEAPSVGRQRMTDKTTGSREEIMDDGGRGRPGRYV